MNVDLSVTIVNLSHKVMLRDCLASIYAGTKGIRFQVVVVDNASTDGSLEMVRQEFPEVRLIAVDRVQGFAANQNLAMEVAGNSRYILLLNNDTVVLPGALECMVAFMDEHPEVGVLGCKLLNGDGSLQPSCWRGYPSIPAALVEAFYLRRLFPHNSFVRRFEVLEDELSEPVEVDHVLGACMMLRKRTMEQVGPLDESFFLFKEETDWCYRARKAGWKISWIPNAQVIHYGEQTTLRDPGRYWPQGFRSYCRFYRKHQGAGIRLMALKAALLANGLVRILLWTGRTVLRQDNGLGIGQIRSYWKAVVSLPGC